MPTVLSTEGLPARERESFWRQAMSETFVPLAVGEVAEDGFCGFIRADWIGRLMIAEVASAAQDIRRTDRLMVRRPRPGLLRDPSGQRCLPGADRQRTAAVPVRLPGRDGRDVEVSVPRRSPR